MSPKSSQSPINTVCDLCYSRKVRCDRSDPCGNCQDAGVSCSRHRLPGRTRKRPQRASRREVSASRSASAQNSMIMATEAGELAQLGLAVTDTANVPIGEAAREVYIAPCQIFSHAPKSQSTPSSLPSFDAQIAIQHHLSHIQGLTTGKRDILESALHVASHLPEYFGGPILRGDNHNHAIIEGNCPSVELLTWMLNDIKAARFGPFARDYFKYIPESTLREMGLALISKKASPTDFILATVCVNAVSFKFLTTILNNEEDDDTELTGGLSQTALRCRSTAQAAIQKIPMLAPPSLSLLQALLSGVFLYQGTGEVTMCWNLTRAACRICSDLGLDETIRQRGTMTEPEYYCFIWCYMLDKNYSFKMGRPKGLLEVEIGPNIHDMPSHHHNMSEYLSINVDLARIQAAVLPFLGQHPPRNSQNTLSNIDDFGEHLMVQMQRIQTRVDKISSPSMLWEGLDARSEISVLEFACHSTMTMIFHLFERNTFPSFDSRCLQSARQGLSALVSMCLTSTKRSAAAFLHWTLLFYPMTAYFVLFCNVVATSDVGDINLMRTIADCLGHSEMKSRPIAQIRTIFLHFASLSERFSGENREEMQASNLLLPADAGTSHYMGDIFPFHSSDAGNEFSQSLELDLEGSSIIPSLPLAESRLQFNDPFTFLSDVEDL